MSEPDEWAFAPRLRPRQDALGFDLQQALRAAVLLHAEVPRDAATAGILGTERLGGGAVINHAGRELVLTIGYLIAEAESIWLTTHDGRVQAGHALAYDHVTGFGLVLPLGPLNVPSLPLGSSQTLVAGDPLIVMSHGGLKHALETRLVAIREFAGYWEYLLDNALFTSPAHPHWSGASLLGRDGKLLGIGSLLTQEAVSGETFDANMFVPVDLLMPILADMVEHGEPSGAPRPWLGIQAVEQEDHVVLAGVTASGPAEHAGLRAGDVILEVMGRSVATLPQCFRAIWESGPAGSQLELTVLRPSGTSARTVTVQISTVSRRDFLKKPQRH